MKNLNKEEIHNIFQRIKKGEKQAVEELYAKYRELIISISYSIIKDKNIAEEISQMVFLKILQMPTEKMPSSNEFSWLYTVTKNQTIDYVKKQHKDIDIEEIYDIPNNDDEISTMIDIDSFNRMIAGLEEDEKEIVSLKVLAEFTFKEIGIMLNMPTATIQWKYYKSVRTLQILLSNLSMFIISLLLYVNSKKITEEKQEGKSEQISSSNTTNENNYKSFNNIEPHALDGLVTETEASAMELSLFSNNIELGLFSISTIFLIITIIFGIIFIKHQQKRHHKSSK